jgi:hypothetical protein
MISILSSISTKVLSSKEFELAVTMTITTITKEHRLPSSRNTLISIPVATTF